MLLISGSSRKGNLQNWHRLSYKSIKEFMYTSQNLYIFWSHSRKLHSYRDTTIGGGGLESLGLCSALIAFEQRVIFPAIPALT